MMRRWIKTKAATLFSHNGMGRFARALTGSQNVPVVIGYHRVVEDFEASAETSIPSMLISRRMLERQLDWLGRRYRFVTVDELGSRLEGNDSSTDPVAAVTFDDGYRDFYEHALPLLTRKGIPAAVFVVTGLVGTDNVQIHDKLYLLLVKRFGIAPFQSRDLAALLERLGISAPQPMAATPYQATRLLIENLSQDALRRIAAALERETQMSEDTLRPFHSLSWEMLERIHRAGITVGSHTRTHVLMTNETKDRLIDEVAGSRGELEKRLGTVIRHFAYPSGRFDTASVNAVARAGYRYAYTVCRHRDARHPLLTVPRTVLWEHSCRDSNGPFSGAILNCHINRTFDLVSGCRQSHATTLERGFAYE